MCFDLNKETYIPDRKSNNTKRYIRARSNQPPAVKKRLPQMIGKKMSDLSSNRASFEKVARECNYALQEVASNTPLSKNLAILPTP